MLNLRDSPYEIDYPAWYEAHFGGGLLYLPKGRGATVVHWPFFEMPRF